MKTMIVVMAMTMVVAACGPRVIIATGTTIGLKANPGDPQGGQSPQVTLGYKRAEAALVATKGDGATSQGAAGKPGADAYATFASLGFKTQWFGDTEISTFLATGFAARALTASDSEAPAAAKADVKESPEAKPGPKLHGMLPPAAEGAHGGTGNSFFDSMRKAVGGADDAVK